jgi:protein-tyrosine phosphatase
MNKKPYDEILENLFLGSAAALQYSHCFSMIVNCTREDEIRFPSYPKHCIRLPIDDKPDNWYDFLSIINETKVLEEIHKKINKKESVLVHCYAGIQRSCTVVACYLIKYHGMKYNEAIHFIQNKRPCAFYGNTIVSVAVLFEEYNSRQ